MYYEQSKLTPPKKAKSLFSTPPSNSSSSNILLPIFEDFSAYLGIPDTNIWEPGGGTNAVWGAAYHPPSLGVAMFDGLDETGRPYEFVDGYPKGAADFLESRDINLALYFPGDSLYLSFYWQQGGRGDAPERSHLDSLMLDFWDGGDTTWNLVWGRVAENSDTIINPGGTNMTDTFFLAMVPITDPKYFRTDFKFRFRTRGTQSGSFDIWNVDYIYFNRGRNKNDIYFLDRTLTETKGTVFNDYSAVPANHAVDLTAIELFGPSNSTRIRTLDDTFSSFTYWVELRDELNPNLPPYYIDSFPAQVIDGFLSSILLTDSTVYESLSVSGDSQIISKTFILVGNGDSLRRGYDARINDTLEIYGHLMDFYAYDDGNPEGTIGIRTAFGQVAYQYHLFEPDTLTAFDIQFQPSDVNVAGQEIGLRIWSKLNRLQDDIIYLMDTVIVFPEEGKTFHRYLLDSAVPVSDSIYIGWLQFSDDLVHVGYDQNNNSNSRIFSKTGTSGWKRESDFFPGSMLFRPVFGKVTRPIASPPEKVVQKPNQKPEYNVAVGPNPSSGTINIYGEYDKIRIVDHQGRIIFNEEFSKERTFLDLSDLEDGFYLIYFEKDFQYVTQRIYLKK